MSGTQGNPEPSSNEKDRRTVETLDPLFSLLKAVRKNWVYALVLLLVFTDFVLAVGGAIWSGSWCVFVAMTALALSLLLSCLVLRCTKNPGYRWPVISLSLLVSGVVLVTLNSNSVGVVVAILAATTIGASSAFLMAAGFLDRKQLYGEYLHPVMPTRGEQWYFARFFLAVATLGWAAWLYFRINGEAEGGVPGIAEGLALILLTFGQTLSLIIARSPGTFSDLKARLWFGVVVVLALVSLFALLVGLVMSITGSINHALRVEYLIYGASMAAFALTLLGSLLIANWKAIAKNEHQPL